jgi:hypothetical protein
MPGSSLHTLKAGDEIVLSTGETIGLPVSMRATMAGVILPARRAWVARRLPSGLTPIRGGWGTAPVWLLSVEYHAINGGALRPYRELTVTLGAVPDGSPGVPYLAPLLRTGGYVWHMAVTHEPARAFGEEIWGYPKSVADLETDWRGGWARTTVTAGDRHFITMDVKAPPTISGEHHLTAYTTPANNLLSARLDLRGQLGLWPYSSAFRYTLGDHPKARELTAARLGDRAFARFYASGNVEAHPGTAPCRTRTSTPQG